jgi:hypothetical protein
MEKEFMDKKEKLNEAHPYYSQKVVYSFEDEKVIALNKILNLTLKKKFDWFIEIKVIFLETSKNFTNPRLNGIIKVDEDWYGKQWMEYHYSEPIPDPQTEDISLGDIIGGPTAYNIAEKIKEGLTFAFSKNIESFQWINLYIRTEEKQKQDMIKEDIQMGDIDPTILNFLRRRANKKVFDLVGLKLTQITFENSEYIITSIKSKKENERALKLLLYENNLFDLDDYENDQRNPKYQKIMKTIRYFINQNLETRQN